MWPVQMVANSTGPLSAALAFDATGSYVTIFTIFGILTLVASLCVFLARPPNLRAYASPSRMEGEPFRVPDQGALQRASRLWPHKCSG